MTVEQRLRDAIDNPEMLDGMLMEDAANRISDLETQVTYLREILEKDT